MDEGIIGRLAHVARLCFRNATEDKRMVTDKNTLILLSRLADAQLALAESMRGMTPASPTYPLESLERIAEALAVVEASLLDIRCIISAARPNGTTKLH